MAVSTNPDDPNFGLESDASSPDFGLAVQAPKEEGGVLSGIAAGIGRALNPVNFIKGALDLGHPSDISNIYQYGKTLKDIVSGVSPDEAIGKNIPELQQERQAVFGKLGTREQAAALTGIGLQAGLVALPFVHGKLPLLRDVAFGKTETSVPEAAVEPPPIPPEYAERRFTTPGLRTEIVDPSITEGLARQAQVQGALAEQAAAIEPEVPVVQREATGPITETAVEKAMRRTNEPLRTSAEIATEGPVALASQMKPPEEVIPNAEQIQEPTRANVNVQLPSGEGAREVSGSQMPTNVGGEGVPPSGQGETLQQTQEVAPVPQPEQTTITPRVSDEPHVSAIANRYTQERAAAGEIGEIAPGQGYSTREMAERGLKMSPEETDQHISDLMQGRGDPIKQGMAVRAEEARLSQRSSQLSRIAEENPNNIEAKLAADNAFRDLTDFHNNPVAKIKQVFHATGESLQGELPVDLSTYNGLREDWLRRNGSVPPESKEAILRKTAADVRNADVEANGSVKKLGQEIERVTKGRKLPTVDEVRNNIRERMGIGPCRV